MRKIKFRVYEKDSKTMTYPRDDQDNEIYDITIGGQLRDMQGDKLSKNCELMQYTGLKDKNGKEIYEGDIIKHEMSKMFEVRYDTEDAKYIAFSKSNERKKGSLFGQMPLWNALVLNCVVIGNVYENPELLNDS